MRADLCSDGFTCTSYYEDRDNDKHSKLMDGHSARTVAVRALVRKVESADARDERSSVGEVLKF